MHKLPRKVYVMLMRVNVKLSQIPEKIREYYGNWVKLLKLSSECISLRMVPETISFHSGGVVKTMSLNCNSDSLHIQLN